MPVNRQEFEKIVREMQAKGTPLTMPNLLVRTELPRAQIEEWLEALQRDAKFVPKRAAAKPEARDDKRAGASSKARARDEDEDDDDEGSSGGVGGALAGLKSELLGEVVKSKLGLGGDKEVARAGKPKRAVRTGGMMGLALPPAGLIYSAPYHIAALGTAAYLALAWFGLKTFVYGGLYIVILLHLVGGVLGAGYAWRFNRKGKRAALLPAAPKPRARRSDDDE